MGQHRGLVMSKKGMVCSAHPLSSWVGADVLAKGGNATDAAIAMASGDKVLLPNMCEYRRGCIYASIMMQKTKK